MSDHGLKASLEKASCKKPKMLVPGTRKNYEVLQFHIHTGCENKFNDTGCDANLHVVHVATTDVALSAATSSLDLPDLAVLDLMMQGANEYHKSIDDLISSWAEVSCSSQNCVSVAQDIKSQKFSPYSLIPAETAVYNFQGSLTTPPCWEVVNWNVLEKPVKISFRQILALSNLISRYSGYKDTNNTCVADETVADVAGLTSREIQPLNGRLVVKNCQPISVLNDFSTVAQNQPQDESQSQTSSSAFTLLSFKRISIMGAIYSHFYFLNLTIKYIKFS